MNNKLNPVIQVFYDLQKRDWNERIKTEMKRRGLTEADNHRYCIIATPKPKSGQLFDRECLSIV